MTSTPYTWVCAKCGANVPSGVSHSCPTYNAPPQPAPALTRVDHGFAIVGQLTRIAAAFERIADAFERRSRES